jgi:hypothetical protein
LYLQLLVAEARVESQKEYQHFNVNAAMCGGRGGRGSMCGRGDGGFHGGFHGGRSGGHNGDSSRGKIPCQVCGKTGHEALRCYKRFDASYISEDKQANAEVTSYNVDTDWYIDTGATDHITLKLDKLTM